MPEQSREAAERIYIIGGYGSGKTTLAREMGQRAGLPVHELDWVVYVRDPVNPLRPTAERDARVSEIAASGRWVAEGAFLGWTEGLLDAADVIVWLDHVGWPRVTLRLAKRSVGQAIGELLLWRSWRRFLRLRSYGRRLRDLALLVQRSHAYHRSPNAAYADPPTHPPGVSRTAIAELLARYEHKLIHCRTAGDVEAALERLSPMA